MTNQGNDIIIKRKDVIIQSKDPRFQPNKVDQKKVKQLAKSGVPLEWKDKVPWYRPKK